MTPHQEICMPELPVVPNELDPSGECRGPFMRGCPNGAAALPSTMTTDPTGVVIHTMRYHCAMCASVYRRRYG